MNRRPGLFAWGLFALVIGAATIYSVTVNPLSPFQIGILALTALGLVLAVAALLPRPDTPESEAPDATTPAESLELLDLGVGEQEPLDAGGAEVDLGDR